MGIPLSLSWYEKRLTQPTNQLVGTGRSTQEAPSDERTCDTARTGRRRADTFGWRVTFALVSVLTAVLMASMAVSLPRSSHPAKVRFPGGNSACSSTAASSSAWRMWSSPARLLCLLRVSLADHARRKSGVPDAISASAVIYGCACRGATCTAASWPTKVVAWNH